MLFMYYWKHIANPLHGMTGMNLRTKTQDIIGESYRHALFYAFPGGLRFELSEGGSPLDQVLTALRKAMVICADVFDGEGPLLVHLQRFAPPSRFRLRAMLREFRLAGIALPRDRDIWLETVTQAEQDDDGHEDGAWIHCVFELPLSRLKNLLWCAFSADFPALSPNPGCLIYLLDPGRGIVVHPYDDRGMDVIARRSSVLEALYERHNALLLPYDMDVMRQTFGPPA